jgi:dTDP-4-dehydrorhamnose 3,5-epimerase
MIFTETELAGAWVVDPERLHDERGFFARTMDSDAFAERGLCADFPQCSISFNERAATLRGMHFQTEPHGEAKLVRCTAGAIYDVIVDLRPGSPTHARWVGVELSADNRRALYVPPGFAHGFQTLVPNAEVYYQISTAYVPSASRGVRWDDPSFGIRWPAADARTISERDRTYPDYRP